MRSPGGALACIVWLCRAAAGALGAAAVVIAAYKPNSQKNKNLLISGTIFVSAIATIYMGAPTLITDAPSWYEVIGVVGAATISAILPYINIQGTILKYGFVIAYTLLIIGALLSAHFSESVILLLFMLLLAFIP